MGGATAAFVSNKLSGNVATTIFSKKLVKNISPKVAKGLGKFAGKQVKRLFNKNKTGLTRVRKKDLDSNGNPLNDATYESVNSIDEIIVNPK